jgi:hypothetical protein
MTLVESPAGRPAGRLRPLLCQGLLVRAVKSPGDLNGKSRPPQSFEPSASIGSRYSLRVAAVPRRIDMAELTIPLARRSGAVGTRHLVAGVVSRGVV